MGGQSQKKTISALLASVWSKNKGGGGRAPPLDPPLPPPLYVLYYIPGRALKGNLDKGVPPGYQIACVAGVERDRG